MGAFTFLQLVFALGILVLVGDRVRVLLYEAPVGPEFEKALCGVLRAGEWQAVRRLSAGRPQAFCSQIALAVTGESRFDAAAIAMEEALVDQRYHATRRLRTLRVCATIASIGGLLGAIIALVVGFRGDGLLSLQAGLAERVAIGRALVAMGIGVGTSAACFSAFAILRRAAAAATAQGRAAERAALNGCEAHPLTADVDSHPFLGDEGAES